MTKMLIDRKLVEQSLEALERLQNAIYNIGGEHVTGLGGANDAADSAEKPMDALRAALAEPQEPDSPERRCGGPGCDGTCCQPVEEPVAIVGTQADTWKGYEGQWLPPGPPIKTVHMLRELPEGTLLYTVPPQPAQPQKPVAWVHTNGTSDTKWHPPQRKPLTDDAMQKVFTDSFGLCPEPGGFLFRVGRAVERAHGIGGEG